MPPPVGVGGRSRSFLPPPSGQKMGRGVPVSRVSCADVRAGARAGQRAHPSRLLTPGVSRRPSRCFLQKSGTAAPEAALLSCLFYTILLKINLFLEQKENYGQFSRDFTFILLNLRDNISFPLRLTAGTWGIRPVFGLAGDERCVARSRVPGRVRARAQKMSRSASRSQTPHTVSIRARLRRIFSRRALTIFSDKPD